MPANQREPATTGVEALSSGDLEVDGRLPWSSNYTFLVGVSYEGELSKAIYKPEQGEQPLEDFPPGLFRREVAAYELAKALGWPAIPETIVREDAPYGVGSLQRFVDADFEQHYFTLFEASSNHHAEFAAIATFDLIANNADRKSGHCLLGDDGKIWAIDHGLCFHAEPKLRTVIWEFGEEPVPAALLADIERVRDDLPPSLAELLDQDETQALRSRMTEVLSRPVFPEVTSRYQYPWPLV